MIVVYRRTCMVGTLVQNTKNNDCSLLNTLYSDASYCMCRLTVTR